MVFTWVLHGIGFLLVSASLEVALRAEGWLEGQTWIKKRKERKHNWVEYMLQSSRMVF
jgi:hypothetical protein